MANSKSDGHVTLTQEELEQRLTSSAADGIRLISLAYRLEATPESLDIDAGGDHTTIVRGEFRSLYNKFYDLLRTYPRLPESMKKYLVERVERGKLNFEEIESTLGD